MFATGLSEAEKRFIIDGVAQELRNDGRACHECRALSLESGVLSNCNGSARVTLASTDVCVGVKLVVAEPEAHTPEQGRLECSAEFAPGTPQSSGADVDACNLQLSRTMQALFGNGAVLDTKRLCIVPHKLCWRVHVDALVNAVGGGNLLDALCVAVRAALANTRVPCVHAVPVDGGDELQLEVESDETAGTLIDVSRVPLAITLTRLGAHFLVDASPDEQCCATGSVTISVNPQGIKAFEKLF